MNLKYDAYPTAKTKYTIDVIAAGASGNTGGHMDAYNA
jgi:hypothetical protein